MKKKCLMCFHHPGMVPDGPRSMAECPICQGDGYVDVPDGKEICPDCKGVKGPQLVDIGGLYTEAKCITCDGTGFIDAPLGTDT